MKQLLISVMLLVLGVNTWAVDVPVDKSGNVKPAENACETLVSRIDMASREIALEDANSSSTAPQETIKQLKILSYKQDITNYLALMQQNKCQQSVVYVDPIAYKLQASTCALELIGLSFDERSKKGLPKSCQLKSWKAEL